MKKGFSAIEIVLLIALIGVALIFIVPRYLRTTKAVEKTHIEAVTGAVNSALKHHMAKSITLKTPNPKYPETLDDVSDGAKCAESAPCFSKVLNSGVKDEKWEKVSINKYRYYDGDTVSNFTYDPDLGSFGSDQ